MSHVFEMGETLLVNENDSQILIDLSRLALDLHPNPGIISPNFIVKMSEKSEKIHK